MAVNSNPRRGLGKLGYSMVALAMFIAALVIPSALLARFGVPSYGAWTGIRPLESKLTMLKEFSAAGDVDALVLGSSIVDFGFSAEHFSELMSKHLGHEYRAFNFATGGAEPRTLPKLYRLARTVNKPKNVFVVVPAEQKLAEEIYKGSPDFTLRNAPVGEVINHPWLLSLNRYMWSAPLLRNAPGVRDIVLYGDFRNLQAAVGMEAYAVNAHGDRVSYLMTWKVDDLPRLKHDNEEVVKPFAQGGADGPEKMQRMQEAYFARTDLDAMEELRDLVARDGGQLHLIAHAGAATLWGGPSANADYGQARRDFFKGLAAKLGTSVRDPTDAVNIPTYGVSDVTHLNIYGARLFTRAAFAAMIDKPVDAAEEEMQPPPPGLFPTKDKTFDLFSALLRRPALEAHPLLRFRMVKSLAVPALPQGDLFVALRTPENVDIVVPAAKLGPSDFVAEVNLPPSARPEALVLRLLTGEGPHKVALSNPLEDYEWLTSYPRLPAPPALSRGSMQVLALPPARIAGENLYLALKPEKPLPAELGLRLAPLPPLAGTAIDLGKTQWHADGLVKIPLPSALADGAYDVRIHDAATGVFLGRSQPVQIAHAAKVYEPARVAAQGKPRIADGIVQVTWAGISKPTTQDWVGLFPAGGTPESRLDMVFTRGLPAGEIRFPISQAIAPKLTAGEFEFRLYAAGGWVLLAESDRFKFEAAAPQAAATPSTARGTRAAASAPGARVSGEPTPRIAAETMKVAWSGIETPSPQDWIGLFPAGAAAESRLDFVFTRGKPEGEMNFPISSTIRPRLATGEFELRLYAAGGWNLLARSERVKFLGAEPPSAAASARPASNAKAPRLSAEPNPKVAAETMKVAWSGIDKPSPEDWIGLFPTGAGPESRLDFVFTRGKAEGEINFPISQVLRPRLSTGEYELRLYAAWNLLARSERVKFVGAESRPAARK